MSTFYKDTLNYTLNNSSIEYHLFTGYIKIHYTGCGYYYYIQGKGNGGQVSKQYKTIKQLKRYGKVTL